MSRNFDNVRLITVTQFTFAYDRNNYRNDLIHITDSSGVYALSGEHVRSFCF